jgi:hypothetical protein
MIGTSAILVLTAQRAPQLGRYNMNALDILIVVLALVAVSFPLTITVNIIAERVRDKSWEEGYTAGRSMSAALQDSAL